MNTISTAQEIGQRCRRFRSAQGLSQQALADKIRTTPQNISKLEKEGVHDIEMIQQLSQALGHDLLSDEMDAEGIVGEIGREILFELIKGDGALQGSVPGTLRMCYLLEGDAFYGLSVERINKEIFKLEKIGLCVREQYKDFYGEDDDRLFITAKGVITVKHFEKLNLFFDN